MRIGSYTVHSVLAGRFGLDGGAMFGVVPKVLWARSHPADEENRIAMVSRSLLLAGKDRLILVNTGIGSNWSDKERRIYGIDPSVDLRRSLGELGVVPEAVTHVILTHLHFDHAGGTTVAQGSELVPAFPNALHFVQRKHFEWARSPSERDRGSFRPEAWESVARSGALRFLDGPQELLPGIHLELVHGHTPFQQLVRVSDENSTLLYCSDLVPLASQVRVPWVMAYDLSPVDTVREKSELLAAAAREGWLLFLEHDSQVATCRVAVTDKGFAATQEMDKLP
jgi:glyoxylase-like metal-dependent hydrolase (beta-lactamase superfamily II)